MKAGRGRGVRKATWPRCWVKGDRKGGKGVAVEGWSVGARGVNLSRPLATLSRRAILRITSAASGQEMKIAPTLFNLDKSICYTTTGPRGGRRATGVGRASRETLEGAHCVLPRRKFFWHAERRADSRFSITASRGERFTAAALWDSGRLDKNMFLPLLFSSERQFGVLLCGGSCSFLFLLRFWVRVVFFETVEVLQGAESR